MEQRSRTYIGNRTCSKNDQDNKDNKVIQEQPPSLVAALKIVQKLLLLVSTRQPELHQLVTNLESKLTDTHIGSMPDRQSSITDFFLRT